jgi:hypothetical protein
MQKIRNKKKEGKLTPQKVDNHTTKDLNNSEVNKISNTELKRMINKMNENQ